MNVLLKSFELMTQGRVGARSGGDVGRFGPADQGLGKGCHVSRLQGRAHHAIIGLVHHAPVDAPLHQSHRRNREAETCCLGPTPITRNDTGACGEEWREKTKEYQFPRTDPLDAG